MNERLGSIDARLTAMDGRMATTGELRARMGLVSALIAAWEQSGFSYPESPKLGQEPETVHIRGEDSRHTISHDRGEGGIHPTSPCARLREECDVRAPSVEGLCPKNQ
jgi:hypothetical protein